ncbi:hypothetical protein F5X97DRAFT_318139 [Nemania serpens]|nr:hypothetical protein F5X97DRAFT_318139 [Nemania serpens]
MAILRHLPRSVDRGSEAAQGEFVVVDPGESATVDIVFIPTFGESWLRGWTTQNNAGDYVFWPEQFLKTDIPTARLLVFAYDQSTGMGDYAAHADHLCEKLKELRCGGSASRRPVVLIAHSLGGIVAAQMLLRGDASVTEHVQGLAFFGTPFQGSRGRSLSEIIDCMVDFHGIGNNGLTNAAEVLEELASALSTTHTDVRLATFCELGQSTKVIVDKEAAKVRDHVAVSIPGNHGAICRFKGREGLYEVVVEELRGLVEVEDTDTTLMDGNGEGGTGEGLTIPRRHVAGGLHQNNMGLIHYGAQTGTNHFNWRPL